MATYTPQSRGLFRSFLILFIAWLCSSVAFAQSSLLAAEFAQPSDIEAWQQTIKQTHPAKEGCFQAFFPDTQWQQVFCDPSQKNRVAPSQPPVGAGALAEQSTKGVVLDNAAYAVGGPIRAAEGSFLSVTGVSSITDSNAGNDYWSLQLNTDYFTLPGNSSICALSSCQGWVQFQYQNQPVFGNGALGINYWVTRSSASCQTGWAISSGEQWCNSLRTLSIPNQPISSFNDQIRLSGQTINGIDTVSITIGGKAYSLAQESPIKELPQVWQAAQFNVFGVGTNSFTNQRSVANFNNGSALTVNTRIDNGTTNAPSCLKPAALTVGTAESNNLYQNSPFGSLCCAYAGGKPSIVFAESTDPNPDKFKCADFGDNTITPVVTSAGGGTISPSAALHVPNRAVSTLTIKPNDNYRISSVTGCGGLLSGDAFVGGIFTTAPATTNCSVTASFVFDSSSHVVTPNAGPGGTISPSTPVAVKSGTTQSFTITPEPGYYIASISGCGGATITGNNTYTTARTYTTGAIASACAVSATFSTITISTSASPGGTISPSSVQGVTSGEKKWFTVTPDIGYYIASISGCGGTAVTGNSTFTGGVAYATGAITGNCTVSATFAQLPPGTTYKISTNAGLGGTISPTSATVKPGDYYTFKVTPTDGYYVKAISGCWGTMFAGVSAVTTARNYATGAIIGDCTVTAEFGTVGVPTLSDTRVRIVTSTSASFNVTSNVTATGRWLVRLASDATPTAAQVVSGAGSNTGAMTANSPFVGTLSGLTPNTAYRLYFVATNSAGNSALLTLPFGTFCGPTMAMACVWSNLAVAHSGTLAVVHDVYWIKITPTVTGTWTFTASKPTTNPLYSSTGTLYQSDGNMKIASDYASAGDLQFKLLAPLTAGQTYYLVVDGDQNNAIGNFTVTATSLDCCTVSTSAGVGGTISPPVTTIPGGWVWLTITPKADYNIASISGCGGTAVTSTTSRSYSYATGTLTSNCTVSATFTPIAYTVSTSADTGGSISPPSVKVNPGAMTTLTVKPNDHYYIASISGCGGTAVTGNNTFTTSRPYTTGAITNNCTVSATFAPITYLVSTSAGTGGTISPPVTVNAGATTTLTVTPKTNYYIASISGCGGTAVTGNNTFTTSRPYTTGAITNNCTVSATFAPVPPPQPCSTMAVASTTAACAWSNLATLYNGAMAISSGQYWIKITPATTGVWMFFSSGSASNPLNDPMAALYRSDGTTAIVSDDDSAGSLQFALSAPLTAGQTYYLNVTGRGTNPGNFTVTATQVTRACTTAATACVWSNLATPYNGTVAIRSDENWIKITPATTGTWTFTASKPASFPLYDSIGTLYQLNGTTPIVSDDDSGGNFQFKLSAPLTAGQTYYLKVTGLSTKIGNFTVTATHQ